ncbi:MAG: rod shape-determining protein MreD [Rhodospirillales bacterium]|nr:rod shape-determining protein MreD [Rhodospirillales bacterium]
MRPSVFQRLDGAARNMLPAGVTLLLLILAQIPLHLPGVANIMPPLALIGVYYWAIHRPDLLTAGSAFLIGVLQDLLAGLPLGVSALVLLLVQGIVAARRRFFLGRGFGALWFGFGLVGLAASLAVWVLVSGLAGALLDPRPPLFQFLFALFLFPPLVKLMGHAQSAFLKEA